MAHFGLDNLNRMMDVARTELLDMAWMSNSNGLFTTGIGLGTRLGTCLAQRGINVYATPPLTLNSINPSSALYLTDNYGYGWNTLHGQTRYQTAAAFFASVTDFRADAASGLNLYNLHKFGQAPSGKYYPSHNPVMPNAGLAGTPANGFLYTSATDTANFNAFQRAHGFQWVGWHGDASAAGGSLRPAARDSGVGGLLGQADAQTVSVGVPTSMVQSTFTVAAAARTTNIQAGFVCNNGTGLAGEVFLGPQRFRSTSLTTGICIGPFMSASGTDCYDWAKTHLDNISDAMIDQWIDYFVAFQVLAGQRPAFCLWFNDGFNLMNETVVSIPNGYTADSAAAWADNIGYVFNRWRARWSAKGYDLSRLFCVGHADHPLNSPESADLLAYRSAGYAALHAAFPGQVACIDGNELIDYDALIYGWAGTSWYSAASPESSRLHLSVTAGLGGYDTYGGMVASLMCNAEEANVVGRTSRHRRT